ncbi:MAG: hypothetical protein AB7E32_10770 [Desulfovibrio sp.]
MSVCPLLLAPACHAHYPMSEYLHLRLFDEAGTYGYAAVAEREDCLELHLEMTRWGPQARRGLARDLEWLKARARALGKLRITGIRQEPGVPDGSLPRPDPRWPKFTRLYGFSGQCVLQAAFLELEPEASAPGEARPA